MRKWEYIAAVMVVTVACTKTAPQRPTRLHEEAKADTTLIGMMTMNERMASAADRKVLNRIRTLCQNEGVTIESRWTRLDSGAWLRRDSDAQAYADAETIGKDEKRVVHLVVRNEEGRVLADREKEVTIGRQELPPAVEEAVQEMHEGETRVVMAPWYAAYGPIGDGVIQGYENVEIEICVRKPI